MTAVAPSLCQAVAEAVAVVGGIGQQGLAGPDRAEHVICRAPVMRLRRRQLQRDRQTSCIGHRVDLCRQPAPRAPHADRSKLTHRRGTGGRLTPLLRSPHADGHE